MKAHRSSGKAELLAAAKAVARELRLTDVSSGLRITTPARASETRTDGWYTGIGHLDTPQLRLEIWLDRYSGHDERKLYACFCSRTPGPINRLTRHVPRTLTPIRTIRDTDSIRRGGARVLAKRLMRSEFDVPIVEKYPSFQNFYFGIYSPSRGTRRTAREDFCNHAVAFFEAVALAQGSGAKKQDLYRDVYPQQENRQRVVSHLQRERRSLLADQRKIRDHYQCQVCEFQFTNLYGELGDGFAEAHHLDALSNFRGQVINDLDDLATVCANCHRMLHKMSGRRADFAKLREIVRRHRRGRK